MHRFLFRLSMLVALTILLLTGCEDDKATVARLEAKRDHVKAMLIERASAGEDISPYIGRMEQAGIHFKRREVSQGEAIMDAVTRDTWKPVAKTWRGRRRTANSVRPAE